MSLKTFLICASLPILLAGCKPDAVKPPSCPSVSVPGLLTDPQPAPVLPDAPTVGDLITDRAAWREALRGCNDDKARVFELLYRSSVTLQ